MGDVQKVTDIDMLCDKIKNNIPLSYFNMQL